MSAVMTLKRYGASTFGKMGARPLVKPWTARDYVQDGLVAMWDGIENAGWGVHDPNATVWKDLSDNGYDLAVVRPSAWEPVGIRAIENIVARTSRVIPDAQHLYGEVCVEDSESYGVYFWNDTESQGLQKFFATGNNNGSLFCIQFNKRVFDSFIVNGTIQVDWVGLTAKYNNLPLKVGQGYYNPLAWSNEMVVGGRSKYYGTYGYFCANALIRAIRIYSRSLTANEIAANYAVDKLRFNLP